MNLLQNIAEMLDGTPLSEVDIKGVDGDIVEILQSQDLIHISNGNITCPYKVKSYGQYLMKVFLCCPDNQRLGQWAHHLFSRKFPEVDIPEEIDPFYRDDNLPAFLEFVSEYKSDF